MTIFFTSDLHFSHNNIIKYCQRPFTSADHMDEQLIKNFNSKVSIDDTVYFLGDFSLSNNFARVDNLFRSLNGSKKILIKGNHDSDAVLSLPWNLITPYYELKYNGQLICMMHYPIKIWNKKHHGSICLGGHSHLKTNDFKERYMDVGIDCNEYFPVDINKIVDRMSKVAVEYKHHKEE